MGSLYNLPVALPVVQSLCSCKGVVLGGKAPIHWGDWIHGYSVSKKRFLGQGAL
jgi:hypothetical protein